MNAIFMQKVTTHSTTDMYEFHYYNRNTQFIKENTTFIVKVEPPLSKDII